MSSVYFVGRLPGMRHKGAGSPSGCVAKCRFVARGWAAGARRRAASKKSGVVPPQSKEDKERFAPLGEGLRFSAPPSAYATASKEMLSWQPRRLPGQANSSTLERTRAAGSLLDTEGAQFNRYGRSILEVLRVAIIVPEERIKVAIAI